MFAKRVHALFTAVAADIPVLLWGPPGTGKTASLTHIAEKLGWHMEVLVGATRDRTDFGGFPRYTEEGTILDPFPWLRRILDAFREGRKSLLFVDELTSTPEDVRPVLLRLVNERVAGDVPVPARIVAAANPEEHAVGGLPLEPAIANRLLHLEWGMEPREFARGLREGFESIYPKLPSLPEDFALEEAKREARALLASYIERQPGVAYQMPKDERASRGWPSLRTWTMAADYLGVARLLRMDEEVQALGVVGLVGEAGWGFVAYVRDLDLPRPEDLLADFRLLPRRDDQTYAALQGVVAYLASNWKEDVWFKTQKLLAFVGKKRPDLAAPAAGKLVGLLARARERRLPTWGFDGEFKEFAFPLLEEVKRVVG